jgi:hypothetical protein
VRSTSYIFDEVVLRPGAVGLIAAGLKINVAIQLVQLVDHMLREPFQIGAREAGSCALEERHVVQDRNRRLMQQNGIGT